jgi:hypothetical protein
MQFEGGATVARAKLERLIENRARALAEEMYAERMRVETDAVKAELEVNELDDLGGSDPSAVPLASALAARLPDPLLRRQKGPVSGAFLCGAYRDRTGDLRLAKPALSQLS